jgi:hypothetical protein
MKTKTYNVYKYNELTKEAQQKAVDNLRDINVDFEDWHTCVLEDRVAKLEEYGFYTPKILYSGFSSQGDGACFTATLDNGGLLEFLTKTRQLSKYSTLVKAINKCEIYVNINITHNDRYMHAYSSDVSDDTEMQTNEELTGTLLEEYTTWFQSFFDRDSRNGRTGWYIDECEDIYRHLQTEYEYMTDDSAIIETIKANDYDFTEGGKID